MGAWGTGIFDDDIACDIRGEYRKLLEDGVSADEAAARTIEAWNYLDDGDRHLLWLALAAAQSELGRLDDTVKARAVEIIEQGVGLESWAEAGPSELASRRKALTGLREQLTGPQPARKRIKRPWREATDLRAGDILTLGTDGELPLLRVMHIEESRYRSTPIIGVLGPSSLGLPPKRSLRRPPAQTQDSLGRMRPEVHRISRYGKRDPDWHEVGFELVTKVRPPRVDGDAYAWSSMAWSAFALYLGGPSTTTT